MGSFADQARNEAGPPEYHRHMSASQPARRWPRRPVLGSILVIGGLLAALAPPTVFAQASPKDGRRSNPGNAPTRPSPRPIWSSGTSSLAGPGFIAVGGGFEAGQEVGTAAIWVSEDGWTWQSVALLGDAATGIPRSITATPDGYVAVGSGCCPDRAAVWLSSDGLAWERLPDQPGFADAAMLGVTWQDDGLVAVGCSAQLECFGGLSWTSSDGRTWSRPVALDLMPVAVSATAAGAMAVGSSEPYEGLGRARGERRWVGWSERQHHRPERLAGRRHRDPVGILAVGGTTELAERPRDDAGLHLVQTACPGNRWRAEGLERHLGGGRRGRPGGWLLTGWSTKRDGQVPATRGRRTWRPSAPSPSRAR